MTFYQELQLSSTGSKQLIRNTTDKKEKRRHILIYNFKVYLVMAFCVAVVTLYSKITGNDNSDGYSDRMYVNEGEEETKWGTYTRYGDLKPEFDNYEVYKKGN